MVRYRTADATSAAEMFTEDAVQDLRTNLTTCVALGDERVSLALQAYELVRKYFVASFDATIGPSHPLSRPLHALF